MQWSEAVLVAESTPMPAPHAPSSRRYLKGTDGLLPLKPHLKRQTSISSLVLPPPPPRVSRKPRRKGCFRPLLGADDVAGPGLVLGAWSQMGDDHLHSLQLLVLGGNGAHLIGDLVAFHGDVLPFHIRNVQEDVGAAIGRGDEAMALGSTETFADSFVYRTLRSPHRR